MTREVRRQGESAAHGKCGCSSLRVWEWTLTMNAHGVEISIAGGVEAMVPAPNLIHFLLFFILFLFAIMRLFFLGTRSFGQC